MAVTTPVKYALEAVIKPNVLIPEILNEVPTILVPLTDPPVNSPKTLLKILLAVNIPVIYASPLTQSLDVGFVVPIPILVAVNNPTVETPDTDSEVTEAMPPITDVAIPAFEA